MGWGGRIGDVLQSGNGAATLTCVNASGNAVYLTGRNAIQYAVGTGGPARTMGDPLLTLRGRRVVLGVPQAELDRPEQ